MRIRKIADGNPKRGAAATRFDLYRNGMTVNEYVLACEGLAVSNYALFDITWDSDQKRRLIELYD
jgi:hypothetical protein